MAEVAMPGRDARHSVWDKLANKQLKHLVAGGVAGAVSRTCVSPLERLKILYQIQIERSVEARQFQGILSSLVGIGRMEGVRGYFKGNGTNVVRIIPYVAVQFAAYEEFKKLLKVPSDPREKRSLRRLCAGAMAGIMSVTVTYPLDLIRTRLSVQAGRRVAEQRYRNIRHAFKTVLKEEGGFWSGCLYRGIFPTLLGIAPYVGLNFAVYETLKGKVMLRVLDISDHRDQVELDVDLPVLWRLSCGAVSGAVAQTVTYPLDVIRRRMQLKGTIEGLPGFYKGMVPNLLKVAPSVAIAFVSYEITKAKLFGVPISWK